MLRLIVAVLIVFLFPAISSPFGAPDFLPDGPHPRIWLTPAELTDLRHRRDSGENVWKKLKTWCESNIDNAGDYGDSRWRTGYRYSKQKEYILNYALAYQLLKDIEPVTAATYAEKAKVVTLGMIIGASVGEEVNGLKAIRIGEIDDRTLNLAEANIISSYPNKIHHAAYKLGYSSRNIMSVALAYDWLYDYLSTSEKVIIRQALLRWVDWQRGNRTVYNNGVLVNGIRYYEDTDGPCDATHNCTEAADKQQRAYSYLEVYDNFNSGEMLLAFTAIAATYGDFSESLDYFNYVRNDLFDKSLKKTLSDPMGRKGGESIEGWSYGGGHWDLFKAMYTLSTATGEDIFTNFDYPREVLEAFPKRLMGDLKSIPIWGMWTAYPVGEVRIDTIAPLVGIGRRILGDSSAVMIGQGLMDTHAYAGTMTDWEGLMFNQRNHPTCDLTEFPLSSHSVGDGFACSRDSWASDTTLVTVRMDGRHVSNKESYDEGTITLGRGPDRLLVHQNLVVNSQSNNTIVFNESNHRPYDYGFSLRSTPCINRYEAKTRYSYVSGDITSAWMYKYGPDYAKLFRRSLLHLRPGFIIVYDVTRSEPSRGNLKGWYTNYIADPTINEHSITVNVGCSKSLVKTMYPLNGKYTKTNPSPGFWRVKYEPKNETEYNQFLHVIEATASTQTEMRSSSVIVSNNGKMRGLQVIDSTNDNSNWTVLFSADKNGNDVDGDIGFTVNIPAGVSPENYNQSLMLCNLPAHREYTYIPHQDRNNTSHEFLLKNVTGTVSDSSTTYYNVKSSAQGLIYFQDAYDPNAPCVIQDLRQKLN